jgi:pimeloyl-CoA dehydrogenase large subunit
MRAWKLGATEKKVCAPNRPHPALRATFSSEAGEGVPARNCQVLKGITMDLRFTDEELAFREEVRAFVKANLPESIHKKMVEGRHPSKDDMVSWTRILNKKGWSVPHWPKEWGGTGWSPVQQLIFTDELQQASAPESLSFGTSMVGPVIYTFGSEAQKRQFLPRIANIDDWWCQGFSEPGAGSDLAGLKTTAKREGGEWVINGQKTWTTLAQHADWIFVLARTDATVKKQEGISFILVDMKTPGVTVRPIQTIDGGHEVNEVFFDNVRVPLENLVGEENKGWTYAKFLLGNERNGIARVGISKARIKRIRELASLKVYGDKPKIEDPLFRMKLAAVEVELKALEMTQLRVIAGERNREKGKPDPASSVLKIKGSEIQQATSELLMDVVGPYALPFEPEREDGDRWNEPPVGPDWAATIAPTYFNLRKVSIYGGSNEIQRGIIAKAILGL